MSLLREIHQQPRHVRMMLFALSVVTTMSFVGLLWFNSFQGDMYALLNTPTPDPNADQVAQESRSPFTILKDAAEDTMASFFGLFRKDDGEDTLDIHNEDVPGKVRTLPLSETR